MATKTVKWPNIPVGTAVRAYLASLVDYERRVGRVPIADAAVDDGVIDANHEVSIDADPGTYALLAVVNEVQEITVDATGGQWKATYAGQQTADLAFDISAADLKTAIVALSNVNAEDVTVSGGPGDDGGTSPYVVTFTGQYAGENVAVITTQAGTSPLTGGAGTATVATETQGAPGTEGTLRWLTFTVD